MNERLHTDGQCLAVFGTYINATCWILANKYNSQARNESCLLFNLGYFFRKFVHEIGCKAFPVDTCLLYTSPSPRD